MKTTRVPSKITADSLQLLLRAAIVTIFGAIFCPLTIYAQPGTPIWTNLYAGPLTSADISYAVAVDTNGNVYVTGQSSDPVESPCVTIAYSSAGTPLWTNIFSGGDEDKGFAIAVGGGNVYVTGYSFGDSYDFLTLAYSSAGVPLWTNYYDGPDNSDDYGNAIAVGTNGNVYVTGESDSSTSWPSDYATIAYSSTGVPLWTNRYGMGHYYDVPLAVAVDTNGNVYVTGRSHNGGNYDYATLAYSSAGVPLWTNRYNGTGNFDDDANAIALGGGNVYVTGSSYGPNNNTDYATLAYSSDGMPLWTNRYDGPGHGNDTGWDIAVNGGNVYVTGGSSGSFGNDYATLAYSSAGVPLWTNRYDGPSHGDDYANAVALDSSDNVFVTGQSQNGYSDFVTLGYSSAGAPLWTNRYDGQGRFIDIGRAIAVDRAGNVYVTGESYGGSSTSYDYAIIKYAGQPAGTVLSPVPLNVLYTGGNQVVLSWTNAAFGLQTAPGVGGVYTNIPAAMSPYTNTLSGLQQYFRLRGN